MTPKEKAKELFDKFLPLSDPLNDNKFEDNMNRKIHAKECAIIVVNQVCEVLESGGLYMSQGEDDENTSVTYWIAVEKEINLIG